MPTQEEEEQQRNQKQEDDQQRQESLNEPHRDSGLDSDSDSDSDKEEEDDDDFYVSEGEGEPIYTRPGDEPPASDNTPEINIRRFTRLLESKRMRQQQEEEDKEYVDLEELYDFPEDPQKWTEEDLQELWADAPLGITKPGWDPAFADEEDWEVMREEVRAGRNPPIAPFYLPYRKPYPAIPDNHYDISNPKAVIEELDRTEEFLTWVSYIFADGGSYEGTVWDDLAHGKGVYIAEQGLVRYEGEWLQNNPDGHGVLEVNIPDIEPIPGSKLEAKMRAEGKIIKRDYMSPEDREWLEMDIEDMIELAGDEYEIPFYESDEWIRQFGRKPEKGRYRLAGQWKHARMHGCGVVEVNERPRYGRFYFGELLEDSEGCDDEIAAMHVGLAEVAAAKARMFVNKPDGMVREERGPYTDPQHPYFYEEDDVWMAPGFINQFYEVPDYWKVYVHEVDQEREMWLNSFYKSPFRIPMPAELEYWWENDKPPEYVLVNKEPEPDPEDPSKLIYTESPLILHTPTGRLINYIEDEEYGIRLFWQPPLKEGETVDQKNVEFLPLGFEEFYGQEEVEEKETMWTRIVKGVINKLMPVLDKVEKWVEEKKKASEMKLKLYEKELELIEAEICLEEEIEEMDEELKRKEKEEERMKLGLEKEDTSAFSGQAEKAAGEVEDAKVGMEVEEEEEEDEEEWGEDSNAPSSFGSVAEDENPTNNDQKGKKTGEPPFSSSSSSFASCSLVSSVPSMLQQSFLSWKQRRLPPKPTTQRKEDPNDNLVKVDSVSFPRVFCQKRSLRARIQMHQNLRTRNRANGRASHLHSLCQILAHSSTSASLKGDSQNLPIATSVSDLGNILSLNTPMSFLEPYTDTSSFEPHCHPLKQFVIS